MEIIYLDELLKRMHHPDRARQLVAALRRQIREGLIDGFELDEDIEIKLGGERTGKVKQVAMVRTRALEEWFEVTNLGLRPPKPKLRRPTREMVDRGDVDITALVQRTREIYRAQAEAGKRTQAKRNGEGSDSA